MATTSIIAAVMTKFDALNAVNFPGASRPVIYLDEAVQADGAQVRPPYVILRDKGLVPNYLGFERQTAEVDEFDLEVYYASTSTTTGLQDVDTAVVAIKLNGGTRDQALGFDLGILSDLTAPRSTHQILRTRETRRFTGLNLASQRTYVCILEYRVTVLEAAS